MSQPADPPEYTPPEPTLMAMLTDLLTAYHEAGEKENFERRDDLANDVVVAVEMLLPVVENLRVAASYVSHQWETNLSRAAQQLSQTLAEFERPYGA